MIALKEKGNPTCIVIRVVFVSEFMKIYERLDIENLVDRGESFYNDLMPAMVQRLDKMGLFFTLFNIQRPPLRSFSHYPTLPHPAIAPYPDRLKECCIILDDVKVLEVL